MLYGLQAAVAARLGRHDLDGVRVAVQGLGNVGFHLCHLLTEAGARVLVADLQPERVQRAVKGLGAEAVDVDQVMAADVDVVAPCAMGGVLSRESVATLRACVVAGSANNQLASDDVGELLTERGVLYAPDYVINAGGVISVAHEYLGYDDPDWVDVRIAGIVQRLQAIFERAARTGQATSRIADELARERLAAAPEEGLRGVA